MTLLKIHKNKLPTFYIFSNVTKFSTILLAAPSYLSNFNKNYPNLSQALLRITWSYFFREFQVEKKIEKKFQVNF